jgi:TolB protein
MQMTISRARPAPAAEANTQSSAATANQPQYLPDSLIDYSGREPDHFEAPVVNIFGEFSRPGAKRNPAALVADVGLRQHTFVDAGFDADVAVDPTGQYLAFSAARDGERTQIYLQPTNGTAVTQLTNVAADNAQPCFSPDGKRIAFCSNRSGRWHLYVMNVDGRAVTQLTDGPSNEMHPTFSPDGARLAFCALPAKSTAGPGDQWELYTLDLVSREKLMLGYGLFPAWSPDKTHDTIAFQKTRARGSRWFSLWTLRIQNGEPSAPTEIAVSSNAALVSPSWTADGKHLAFASIVEPAQTKLGKPQGQQDVWIMDADGENRRRITDGIGTNLSPCCSVDNRVYFISDRCGHECIWSLPTSTTESVNPNGNEVTASRQDGEHASPRPAPKKELEPSSAANDPSELKP